MNFKIPEPIIPTDEEMVPVAQNWYNKFNGLKFPDWNDELKSVSYPFIIVDCDYMLIEALLQDKMNENKKKAIETLSRILHCAILKYDQLTNTGFFVKLITRSPKDFLYDENNFGKPKPLLTAKETVESIICSMRTFEDLCLLHYLKIFKIIIRPYINFHPKNEWRCFIENKNVVGISQYYYEEKFDNLNSNGIKEFIENNIITNVDLNNFVADVVNENGCWLLELNPYGLSDPCLYYDYNNFDNSVRYN